ncbi:MAG: ParB/RepB/Spo0J family partition protein [Gammaproteobacteria bacterium]
MARCKGLGRGLDALLSASATVHAPAADGELRHLPIDLIQPGALQPRRHFDQSSLDELADSIRARGIVQPLVVRSIGGGRYELVAGERRWRAAQAAEMHDVPALVRDLPDDAVVAVALVENIQREDLNAIEEALALKRLLDEFGLTHAQIAEGVGRSRVAVTNLLRLLDLNDDVRALVENGDLEMGHARALLALDGPQQSQAARRIVEQGLSARAAEALVKRLKSASDRAPQQPVKDPDIARLERELSEHTGARVELSKSRGGRGKLTLHYSSLEQLDGLLERLGYSES